MRNMVAEQATAESFAHLYSSYLRTLDVQLPALAEGVTFTLADSRACGCREDECYFCGAIDDAIDEVIAHDEWHELTDRYGWDEDVECALCQQVEAA